jgi:hypothetical protein
MAQPRNDYTAEYPSILDVTSGEQELIALLYGDSKDSRYNALGFQVQRVNRRVERVLNSFTLSDGNGESFGKFGEDGWSNNTTSPGDDVFRLDSDRSGMMVEYGFAVPQDGVYVAIQATGGDEIMGLPSGDDRERGFDETDLQEFGSALSDHTYLDTPGSSTDAVIPTTALSASEDQGVIRIDSDQNGLNTFRFAFNNQSGGQVTIDMIAVGKAYKVQPITNRKVILSMLRDDIPSRTLTWGGFGNTRPNLPREWNEYVQEIRKDELLPAPA